MDSVSLLRALAPTAERLLDRHLAVAKEWFPHELVPWDRARSFAPGESWSAEEAPPDPGVHSSLVVNVLTEDNLPHYLSEIDRMMGRDGVWGVWARRWTAEEGRHSIVLRDYLTVTRQVDPVALERARMAQVGTGQVPHPPSPADGFVYLALQELATRLAHHNTGKAIQDPAGYQVMKRVAADENLHYLFYRDLVSAALEVDPSAVVAAMERQVRHFEMPGTGIPGFLAHARAIARSGIYDFSVHHDRVLVPVVLQHWGLDALQGLSAEAERARERLTGFLDRMGKAARRLSARREEQLAMA
ncbi:MAG: acyl-ACP desaturase [Acidimicrobiales bacterium]